MKTALRTFGIALALMMLTMPFVSTQKASAQCAFTVISNDTAFTITSKAGTEAYRALTFKNNTASALPISYMITGPDAALFSVSPQSVTLEANAQQQVVKIVFTPNSATTSRASAHITFGALGMTCFSATLYGVVANGDTGTTNYVVVDPAQYAFPKTEVGTQVCKNFVFTNKGTSKVYVSGWDISTDLKEFSMSPASSATSVAPGQSISVQICFTPTNTTPASTSAYLSFHYSFDSAATEYKAIKAYFGTTQGGGNDSTKENYVTIDPAQYTFPGTDIGKTSCKEFTLKNMGKATAFISTISLSSDSKDLSINAQQNDTLAPGATMTFQVCYTPTSSTKVSGYIIVDYTFDGTTTKELKATVAAGTSGVDGMCLSSEPTDAWKGQVLLDSTADRILRLYNKTGHPITVTSATLTGDDAKAFTITESFPFTVGSNSSYDFHFTFKPFDIGGGKTKEKYTANIAFGIERDTNGLCEAYKTILWGYSVAMHTGDGKNDSANYVGHALFPADSDKKVIGLSNTGIRETYTLLFYNNLNVTATVESISMKEGTYFHITSTDPATTPFAVQPGGEFTVTISFEATDKMIHKDALVIVADHSLAPMEFDLEGINYALASVKYELPKGVAVFVSPNPAYSDLKVDFAGVAKANIEVIDMLGNTIARGTTSGDWTWNGKTTGGTPAANGAYILRIAGESISGEQFVTSKRFVLQH
jgi:P pilus assembly chaperone PapD